jgi:uracil-DNA glycosylase
MLDGQCGAFVGEGPGADEDAQGVPFVNKAGQLLDRMIVVALGPPPMPSDASRRQEKFR